LASQPTSLLSTPTLASSHLPAGDQSARRAGSGAGHLPTSRFTVVGFCHCGVLAPPVDPGSNTETHQNHTKRPDHGQNRDPPHQVSRTSHQNRSPPQFLPRNATSAIPRQRPANVFWLCRDTARDANQGHPASCDATTENPWHRKVSGRSRSTRRRAPSSIVSRRFESCRGRHIRLTHTSATGSHPRAGEDCIITGPLRSESKSH
jgi:hypothetical protein